MAKTVDFLTNLDVHPDSNHLLIKSEDRSIADSIRLRLLVGKSERPFEDYGSSIKTILFDQFSDQATNNLQETIRETASQETRAFIEDVEVLAQPQHNRYVINIYYRTNFSQNLQKLPMVLYRVR